ncbi:hypothetical protein PTSG_08026 [Salpingoeca rosetta]|uniref:Presequence translocated-associated motor subunit PAM17, mitochondrial n=1 Tax=Salpingoeca rosetta (strain ATCC 50818 / BSB-021) TaxID=946362 RepID=F2UHS7_SALR5|nr:uncharacterized protein PTSG_08026 [Salpingoeca rosetta]EGD76676.1 hypothetical protein PTSG_08026 [Salpingoeca rosetta]|eukprot:XP_004991048.1 hypothetical protein PTSG_08026 [Salpingoeca rosetta]
MMLLGGVLRRSTARCCGTMMAAQGQQSVLALAARRTPMPVHACIGSSMTRHMATDTVDEEEKKRQREIEALQARNVDRSLLRQLPFNDYVKLRRKLSIRGYLFGVPCFFTGIVGSAYVCATQIPNLMPETAEQVEPIMGLDPMLFATLTTTLSGFVSFFVGTALFKVLWRTFFRQHAAMLDANASGDFAQHTSPVSMSIQKNRCAIA